MGETYNFAEHTIRRTMADQIVFLQTVSSQYYVASGVGLIICDQIDKGLSFDSIVAHICETFDVDKNTATKDAMTFCSSLESAGIIIKTSN